MSFKPPPFLHVLAAILLVGFSLVRLAGCARREQSPVVDVTTAAPSSVSANDAPSVPSQAPQGSATVQETPRDVYPGSCEARGLRELVACPGGAAPDPLVPELLRFCCATGPIDRAEEQGCFVALETAKGCKDADGQRAAAARIDALARRFGEPCKRKDFREPWSASPGILRICAERGYP